MSASMQDPSPLHFSDKDRLDKVKNGLTTDQKFASKTNALRTGPSPIATERLLLLLQQVQPLLKQGQLPDRRRPKHSRLDRQPNT